MVNPIVNFLLQELSQSMSDVVFLKVDVDECEDIAQDNQIACMPTFLFMKNGQKVRASSIFMLML